MTGIIIRPARADDIGTIHDFILALADYERLAHAVKADRATLARYLFGERPMAEVLIAEHDGMAVGFALFFHNFSTFEGRPGLYLEDLFVRPEHRGNGIGEALLRHLAHLAVERGCGRLEWAVLDWNKRAIEFYERMGARGVKEWTIFRVSGDALTRLGS